MTNPANKRIILTNKKTGQVLPEAELRAVTPEHFEVVFDGCGSFNNFFTRDSWAATYPRMFRNGNVIRPVDSGAASAPIVYFNDWWSISGRKLTDDYAENLLKNDDWELA